MLATVALIAVCAASVLAKEQPGGQLYEPTPAINLPQDPSITIPPSAEAVELKKRATGTATSICGYLTNATPLWSYWCASGYYCGYDTTSMYFGCCQLSTANGDLYNCYQPTACADYGKLSTRNTLQLWQTHSCTDSAYPYCATYYESGLKALGCNRSPSQTATLQFTLNGNAASRTTAVATDDGAAAAPRASSSRSGHASVTVAVGPATSSESFGETQATGSVGGSASSMSSGNGAAGSVVDNDFEWLIMSVVGMVLPWI